MTEPPTPRIPVSTYRLQFNKDFGFADAKKIIPYLNELGITDVYASPYFKARQGSLHGYDIVDQNTLNPELGNEEEYNGMMAELAKYGMGQVLDIVPNHMCIDSTENSWWTDVLENGPSSVYADYFDIDWKPVKKELENKVLLPVLGDQYGRVLDNGELRLSFGEGAFYISYYENRFPVRPGSEISLLEHGLGELDARLGPEHPNRTELLSILTALKNLPPYTQTEQEKIAERHREKEVIKKRLWNLYRESPEIRDFMESNIKLFNGVKGDARSFDLLDGLIREQVYRLSHWRVASDEINYRRFFDINNLACIRMSNPAVFRETHRLVLKLIKEGQVTGLRVDHPDGLYDPSRYMYQLQESCCDQVLQGRGGTEVEASPEYCTGMLRSGHNPFYIVGEKILIKGETMPEEWPIFSTTGYVFLNSVNGIFADTDNGKVFEKIYEKFIGLRLNFQDIVYEKKKLVMQVALSSEINTLGHYLNRISEKNRYTRDFTLNSLTNAIAEVIAFFPVYRTYINSSPVADRDRQYINSAVSKAKRKNPAISSSIFDFFRDVLLLKFPEAFDENEKQQWLDFVMRFQQLTGPVMAKGVEDTAFYVYNRLVSLNEVGGMPDRFGTPLDTFHGQNIERQKSWPHALIATSTHDTKRGEDVRTRIDVLSEMPEEWRKRLANWNRLNKKKKTSIEGRLAPDQNEEYFIYQTLLGSWLPGGPDEPFRNRIKDYMLKALREAKVNTSWISPDNSYENAVTGFVERLMDDARFLEDFRPFAEMVSYYGMYYSLSQVLLKITSPGVPDFYQGTELWGLSLVDPDNRRPVDYDVRMAMLAELKRPESEMGPAEISGKLMAGWQDGRIKLYLTWKALNFRRMNTELFGNGEYIPLAANGTGCESICAFARKLGEKTAITAVPRLLARRIPYAKSVAAQEIWKDTAVVIPFAKDGERYRNFYTGEVLTAATSGDAASLKASELFSSFPVALLDRLI